MKPKKFFLITYFLFHLYSLVVYGEVMKEDLVEGIFYLDGTPISVSIQEGFIKKIERISSEKTSNLSEIYIAPGFIDNQVNGYMDVAFAGEELTVEKIRRATQALWEAGVTTFLPTLTTNTHELLLKNFGILAKAVQDPDLAKSIPGFHLEGPYISPVDGYRGAHVKEWVRVPNWEEFLEYYKASGEKILQVSLAPEVEGALEFMQKCREKGIHIGLAHHSPILLC